MSDFFELEIFSAISEEIIEFSKYIKSNPESQVEISGPPSISGIIGLAFIESAFIELGYRYSRSFHENIDPNETRLCIQIGKEVKMFIPKTVNLRMGHDEREMTGVLDAVAQVGALSLTLNPGGRTSNLEPWLLSGSWLRSTLDMVYNPVYTSLRDYLRSGGVVSVVCMPEVPELDSLSIPEIDVELLEYARKSWSNSDEKSKAKLMDALAVPLIAKGTFSVQRVEELCWYRILKEGWRLDMASQCAMASRELSDSENRKLSASRMLDALISNGNLLD